MWDEKIWDSSTHFVVIDPIDPSSHNKGSRVSLVRAEDTMHVLDEGRKKSYMDGLVCCAKDSINRVNMHNVIHQRHFFASQTLFECAI